MITGVRFDVEIVGAIADCLGCIVGLTDVHPAKAKTRIKKRDNKANGFIIQAFPIVPRLFRDDYTAQELR